MSVKRFRGRSLPTQVITSYLYLVVLDGRAFLPLAEEITFAARGRAEILLLLCCSEVKASTHTARGSSMRAPIQVTERPSHARWS